MELRHRLALALLSVPLAAALTACSGGGDADQTTSGSSRSSASEAGDSGATVRSPRDAGGADSDAAAKPAAASALQRAVIATGSLHLTTKNLDDARSEAIGLATGLGGHVDNEQSRSDRHGRLVHVELTLRVPAASFQRTLDALGRLGAVQQRQQSVEDVTTQVIDNSARVRAQSASVESVEQLLARANTIGEVISVENELARRQADLDSLKQQQRWLFDQTAMSTVQVSIARSARAAKRPAPAPTGFLSGLEGGWHALARSTVALSTVVGALLPFAVVLALVGGPAWMAVRRRRAVPAPPAPEV